MAGGRSTPINLFILIHDTEVRLTMSSREIAELTGKEHRNVLADMRKMLQELGVQPAKFSARYKDAKGEMRTEYRSPKREALSYETVTNR